MSTKFSDLITSVDVLNTLHGGVSEPSLSYREHDDGREMRVRVPGVGREELHVEIVNNQLSIFYTIPILSNGKWIQMPQVVYNQAIPTFVEVDGIKARFDENELMVKLPYNEKPNGKNRRLSIEE